jgi:hypothetical protein
MNIDIDEMQKRIQAYYDRRDMYVCDSEFQHVAASIVHLTEKMGKFAHAFTYDQDQMVNAVAEIIIVSLQVLNNLKQKASTVLEAKVASMDKPYVGKEHI